MSPPSSRHVDTPERKGSSEEIPSACFLLLAELEGHAYIAGRLRLYADRNGGGVALPCGLCLGTVLSVPWLGLTNCPTGDISCS